MFTAELEEKLQQNKYLGIHASKQLYNKSPHEGLGTNINLRLQIHEQSRPWKQKQQTPDLKIQRETGWHVRAL